MKYFACDNCGLCCKQLIIEVDPLDVLREPLIAEKAVHLDGHGKLHILDSAWSIACGRACAFLGEGNRCGIYASRPNVCVEFQAGQAKCQELRRSAGLPELQPIDRNDTTALIQLAIRKSEEEDG
jgi:Fe-S-cluster containining protein